MKKYFFAFVSFLCGTVCYAQNEQSKDYKWTIGLEINTLRRDLPSEYTYANNMQTAFFGFPEYDLVAGGYSLKAKTKDKSFSIGTTINHSLKENNFMRLKFDINKIDISTPMDQYSDSIQKYSYTASKKRNDFAFAFGMGRSIVIQKIVFDVGFEIPLWLYGKENMRDYYEVSDINGPFVYSSENKASFSNGFSTGLGSFAGFSFSFKSFSVGSEVSAALLYSKYTGKGTFEHINTYASQNPTSITESRSPSISLLEFSKVKASIKFTYHF